MPSAAANAATSMYVCVSAIVQKKKKRNRKRNDANLLNALIIQFTFLERVMIV